MNYWIVVASAEHVAKGVKGGFMQVCHGKAGPLKQIAAHDWIVYYSPTKKFGEKEPCRQFTAIGKISDKDPYQHAMSPDFIPWRRDVNFVECKSAFIEPLINQLSFIKNKKKWGFPFRRGYLKISKDCFSIIAQSMGIAREKKECVA